MKIKSNAAPGEFTSPFYKINEDFCETFENYIASKNGKVKGNYNAWSYFVQGILMNPRQWHLKYKKAPYTSTGNLLLSNKKQNLLCLAEWSCDWPAPNNSEFAIRRKDSVGLINKLFKRNYSIYKASKDYLISGGEKNIKTIENVHTTLKPLFDSKEIYSIILVKNKLIISFRTEEHHFEFFERLNSV
ncbi:hypothetical protein QRD02_13785 [Aequorivita sp. SDUM287046]|uniref:Uncharacterized protein n=1 Tax=Aequorivita aurantiaca TaxID=3053356 RepID=A0ABT8DNJ1_9FLAO|nr:hypothetical protein [Aequorivita aurantiaca]MDN3725455.1 hypothetical protein [Aequorivita aurantiaca]